jgi:hypothetical protein
MALRGERRSDASLTLSSTSNSVPAFWIASIFVRLSFAGSVAVADVEAPAVGVEVIGCWISVLFFFLSLLISFMVTTVRYYDPRMASTEIEDAVNDEVGAQDLKMISDSHEIVREQYFRETFGFKE